MQQLQVENSFATGYAGPLPQLSLGSTQTSHSERPFSFDRNSRLGYEFARNGIAIVLLFAAGLKVQWILSSRSGEFESRQWTDPATLLLIIAEWAIATWLLTGLARVWARRAALTLLSAFAAVSGWHLLFAHADCGCFGILRVHPAFSFSFDIVAGASIYWFGNPRNHGIHKDFADSGGRLPAKRVAIAVSILLPIGVLGVSQILGIGRDSRPMVVVDAQTSLGKPFRLLEFVEGESRADLISGRHTIILFNRHCDACRNYLSHLAMNSKSALEAAGTRVIDIAPSEAGESDAFLHDFQEVRLRSGILYVANVPLEISLNDGVVEATHRPE